MKAFSFHTLFILLFSLAYSQQDGYRFRHFSTEDGLAHIAVNTIYQDSYGYLWLGTWNGLSRYDGYRFRNYIFDAMDPLSLTHGTIYAINENSRGELWVGTEAGLDHYLRSKDRFEPFLANCEARMPCGARFTSLEFDKQNRLWASHQLFSPYNAIYREDEENGFQEGLPISMNKVVNTGRYWWVIRDKKLILFEPESMEVYPPQEIFPVLEQLWEKKIFTLAKGPDGEMWMAANDGLYVYAQGKLQKQEGWPTQKITALLADSKGGVWMGTSEGLYHRAAGEASIQLVRHDPVVSSSLSSNEINCLYEDRQANVWIGTERGGLNAVQLSPGQSFDAFDHHRFGVDKNSLTVYALLKTRNRAQIWAGTNQGIFIFDAKSRKLIRHMKDELPDQAIRSLYEDQQNNIWVGSLNNKLIRFSPPQPGDFSFERMADQNGSIRRINEGPGGGLWIAGRSMYFLKEGQKQKLTFERLPSHTLPNTLPYIWDFQFQDSCHVWIACNQGLFFHDVCTDSILHTQLFQAQGHPESMNVFDLHIDEKRQIWLGLWGGGLARFDPINKSSRRYGQVHGLPGNHVYGILEDGQNQLWLSTDYGIARFNPRTERFNSFTQADGLMSNEFDSGAFFEAEDGEMFFGGRNGFVCFRPWEIPAEPKKPMLEVRLTSFRISGEDFQRKKALEAMDSIVFSFDQNQVLEFSFSAFDFSRIGETRYKYRLLGFEEEWSAPTRLPTTRYTDLSPGRYTLEIMASNSNSFAAPDIRQIHLHIRPLLVQKSWFKILTIGSALFLLSLLVYIRTRRLNRRENTLLRYKAALAKQEALAAQFDHHFTFNSLNSIQRFLIEKENNQAIRYISRFGKLIRRVMHQARQNAITIEDEMQTLELYLSLEQLRVRFPFTYDIRIDKEIDPFSMEIPTMLIQPYVENAIWHGLMPAEKPGHIILSFHYRTSYLLINIEDNGIGRKKSAELKARSSMKHESRGMALARERLQGLNIKGRQKASIKIHDLEDDQGKALGTKVELQIPIG